MVSWAVGCWPVREGDLQAAAAASAAEGPPRAALICVEDPEEGLLTWGPRMVGPQAWGRAGLPSLTAAAGSAAP